MDQVTVLKIPEVDDTNPNLVTFDLVDEAKVRAITDTFKSGNAGCMVKCDGQTYRPFLVERTKPGWWRVSACRLNMADRSNG